MNYSGIWYQTGNDIEGRATGDNSGCSLISTIVGIGANLNHGINGEYSGHYVPDILMLFINDNNLIL